jgi:hypothetical protein
MFHVLGLDPEAARKLRGKKKITSWEARKPGKEKPTQGASSL